MAIWKTRWVLLNPDTGLNAWQSVANHSGYQTSTSNCTRMNFYDYSLVLTSYKHLNLTD